MSAALPEVGRNIGRTLAFLWLVPGLGLFAAGWVLPTSFGPQPQIAVGTVQMVDLIDVTRSSPPYQGTQQKVTLDARSFPGPVAGDWKTEFYFDSSNFTPPPRVSVGDEVQIWTDPSDSAGSRAIKLESQRGTWISSTGRDKLNPAPALIAESLKGLALAGGSVAVVLGLAVLVKGTSGSLGRIATKAAAGWGTPLLWLVLIPVVTVPITMVLTTTFLQTTSCVDVYESWFGKTFACRREPVALALIPGLLNLLPFLALRSTDRKRRLAAIVACVFGSVRLIVPIVAVLTITEYKQLSPWFTSYTSGFGPNDMNREPIVSFGLWLATLIALAVLWRVFRGRRSQVKEALM